jgi:lipopolysaccharide export system protein LptC
MTPKKPSHKAYSAFVRFMRIGLPLGSVLLLVLVFAWSTLENFQDYFEDEVSSIRESLQNGELMNKMEKPVLEASDQQGRPFRVEASKADQAGNDAVDLKDPTGKLTLKDGTTLNLKGNKGHYEHGQEQLNLKGNVELDSSSGFHFKTNDAHFDLKSGKIKGSQSIKGQGPQGKVQAEGFEIQDKGDRIHFKGRTKLIIEPQRKGNKS